MDRLVNYHEHYAHELLTHFFCYEEPSQALIFNIAEALASPSYVTNVTKKKAHSTRRNALILSSSLTEQNLFFTLLSCQYNVICASNYYEFTFCYVEYPHFDVIIVSDSFDYFGLAVFMQLPKKTFTNARIFFLGDNAEMANNAIFDAHISHPFVVNDFLEQLPALQKQKKPNIKKLQIFNLFRYLNQAA